MNLTKPTLLLLAISFALLVLIHPAQSLAEELPASQKEFIDTRAIENYDNLVMEGKEVEAESMDGLKNSLRAQKASFMLKFKENIPPSEQEMRDMIETHNKMYQQELEKKAQRDKELEAKKN
eukprot:Nk52_evm48s239 gene=Nk52_evmTU48s239